MKQMSLGYQRMPYKVFAETHKYYKNFFHLSSILEYYKYPYKYMGKYFFLLKTIITFKYSIFNILNTYYHDLIAAESISRSVALICILLFFLTSLL